MTDEEIARARRYYGDGPVDTDGPLTLFVTRRDSDFLILTGPRPEVKVFNDPPGYDLRDGPPADVLNFIDEYFTP